MRLVQDEEGVPMIVSEMNGEVVIVDTIYVNLDDKSKTQIVAHGISGSTGDPVT